MSVVREIGGERVLCIESDDALIGNERDAADLIGEAWVAGVQLIMVPSDHLPPDFYELRSGLAGAIAQKVANYRITLAVVGDISAYLARSNAFRDWVRETNHGDALWMVPSVDDLSARLTTRRAG